MIFDANSDRKAERLRRLAQRDRDVDELWREHGLPDSKGRILMLMKLAWHKAMEFRQTEGKSD